MAWPTGTIVLKHKQTQSYITRRNGDSGEMHLPRAMPQPTSTRQDHFYRFALALLRLTALTLAVFAGSAEASTPRSQAGNALRQAKKNTDKLVKDLTAFLQMTGRWSPAPKPDDMQMCQSLQSFQQQLDRLEKDNSAQRGFNIVQSEFQQLQFMSSNLDQVLTRSAGNPALLSSWNSVKMDLNNAAQYISPYVYDRSNLYDYDPAASPATPFVPSTPVPTNYFPTNNFPYNNSPYNPNRNQLVPGYYPPVNTNISQRSDRNIQSALRSAETTLDRLVPQVSAYLQSKGRWPPQPGTAEMQLCEQLQYFQQQLRHFTEDVATQTPYPVLQTQVQQLSLSFGNLDRLFFQTGASGEVNAYWNEVRQQLNRVYQFFYSDSPQFWSR